jgi:cytochrome c
MENRFFNCYVFIGCIALTLISCGNEPKKVDVSIGDVATGEQLYNAQDCNTCHKPDSKMVGPSLKEIATRYPANEATINLLSDKIINGGFGNWGKIAMAPHSNISKPDAALMVKYILSLK